MVLVGALVSITLGTATAIVADQQALLGLCVGLLGMVLAFQLDALARFERRAEREDRVARILRDVEDQGWALDRLESIAGAVRAIRGNELFVTAASRTLDRTSAFFKRTALGEVRSEVDIRDLIALVDGTQTSIRATSLARSERTFWTGRGQEYWQANLRALEREVRIERVFVYAGPDEALDRVCEVQLAAGVKVYRVDEAALPSELAEHLLILDAAWSQEIPLDSHNRAREYVYRTEEHEIASAVKRFEQVRDDFAVRVAPKTSSVGHPLDS
jgi:hypothetical protein